MKYVFYALISVILIFALFFVSEKNEWFGILNNNKWNLASVELEREIILKQDRQHFKLDFKPVISSDKYVVRLYVFDTKGYSSSDLKEVLSGFKITLCDNTNAKKDSVSHYEIGNESNKYGIIINPMEPNSIALLSGLNLKFGESYVFEIEIPAVKKVEKDIPKFVLVIGVNQSVFF